MNNDKFYQDIHNEGEKITLPGIWRHRLVEVFLVRVMSFGWAVPRGEVQPAVFCTFHALVRILMGRDEMLLRQELAAALYVED